MKINLFLVNIALILVLSSCGSPTTVKKLDAKPALAQALAHENYAKVMNLKTTANMHPNAQRVVDLYLKLPLDNLVKVNNEIDYLQQFYPSFSPIHKTIFDEIVKWAALKQIYQYEISPPIRILQRDQLYLAKSHIDFYKCPANNKGCANKARQKVKNLMSNDEIIKVLKRMTLKDPCVNLSNQLKGQAVADRCLNMSKGNFKIELLPKPRFNTTQWLQAVSSS